MLLANKYFERGQQAWREREGPSSPFQAVYYWLAIGSGGEVKVTEGESEVPRSAVSSPVTL